MNYHNRMKLVFEAIKYNFFFHLIYFAGGVHADEAPGFNPQTSSMAPPIIYNLKKLLR